MKNLKPNKRILKTLSILLTACYLFGVGHTPITKIFQLGIEILESPNTTLGHKTWGATTVHQHDAMQFKKVKRLAKALGKIKWLEKSTSSSKKDKNRSLKLLLDKHLRHYKKQWAVQPSPKQMQYFKMPNTTVLLGHKKVFTQPPQLMVHI